MENKENNINEVNDVSKKTISSEKENQSQETMFLELDTLEHLTDEGHIATSKNTLSTAPSDITVDEMAKKVHTAIENSSLTASQKKLSLESPDDEWKLCTRGIITEKDLVDIYSTLFKLKSIEEEDLKTAEQFEGISYDYLYNKHCLPIAWDKESVLIAAATPYNMAKIAFDWQALFNKKASFVLARRTLLERIMADLYDTAFEEEDEEFSWDGDTSEKALQNLAKEAPIVRLLNDIFNRAVEMDTSDIHIEPLEHELIIRYRIDGVLSTVNRLSLNLYAAIASRVKLIGGMNIAEHRLPQDGRTNIQIGKNNMDIRISTVPSTHGESIVLRILYKEADTFSFKNIGMTGSILEDFTNIITKPHGILLVVGPTGSGKTTTLYCAIDKLNNEDSKILTIEDPVEYQIEGITQVQAKPSIGLSFANGLRSFLRQDPDIILIGEIRDKETAEIAIHAALTGHLVLSTLHTNNAAGAISRMLEMDIESYLISSALIGVLSQRLVRKICSDCKGIGTQKKINPSTGSSEQKKCRNCAGRGYKGRIGIFEFLSVNDDIRHAINEQKDSTEISEIAIKHGMTTLLEDGKKKVKKGITTASEVSRVCQLDIS
ncbi:MAG: GspE/PulE family protein [Verrucomicrobiota bacterium]|nr:GspE/PulE family protein [Verrucomicrobiota bacterium]